MRIQLFTLLRIRIHILASKESAQIGSYSLHFACHLLIDAIPDPAPVPDPAYHFDADPDFYLMRMQIRIRNTA
jgi:hypothetical protein